MAAAPKVIDDKFICDWEYQYDNIEGDEPEYKRLLNRVNSDIEKSGTLTEQTFTDILDWKSSRVKGKIEWDRIGTYFNTIKKCHEVAGIEKMSLLYKLPGIGAPVASTFLHFIYPFSYPIIDRRTVDVLRYIGYIRYKSTDINQYPAFMEAILSIQKACPKWSLREIDRALFAYHKKNPDLFGTLSKPCNRGF